MSAHLVFEHAPLGSIIEFNDGTPRPPERHRKKLQAWLERNNRGRLIRKRGKTMVGYTDIPAEITLHMQDIGSRSVIVMRVLRSFSVNTDLSFSIVERPAAGSVLVLERPGPDAELVHVGDNGQDAEEWLTRHGYPNAVLKEVTADEAAADVVEGRTAA
ncbi:hypothetical protein [Mesorhizobium xinjiangense]|uniref:hypothetical protein n=1 Tax=Mesorhizobium xinjiangense TaxID=2678685 RepID=UPI0012ECDD47|nr:hypothetical protein [Mesorhizobium xinjiangense]